MAKKRKKKVYNTPKKIKHIHKNNKLNIINVINDNPKCPKCNNSLANHFDRYTCTNCQTSETKN
jgi:ribosomal protein S27AE